MSPTASLRRFTATTGSGGSNGAGSRGFDGGAPRDAFGLLHPPRDRRVPEEHPRLRGELWLERGGSRYRLEFDCDRCEMSLVDCTKTKL